MRKISKEAGYSFTYILPYQKGNTAVIRLNQNTLILTLHGNVIATHTLNEFKLELTLAGWSTVTTRERLNTLLYQLGLIKHKFYQKKGLQYYTNGIDSREIDSNEIITINL